MPGVCPRCLREVYFAEQKVALGKVWHSFCFSCKNCKKILNSCSLVTYKDDLFCQKCYSSLSYLNTPKSKEESNYYQSNDLEYCEEADSYCGCCDDDFTSNEDNRRYKLTTKRLQGGGDEDDQVCHKDFRRKCLCNDHQLINPIDHSTGSTTFIYKNPDHLTNSSISQRYSAITRASYPSLSSSVYQLRPAHPRVCLSELEEVDESEADDEDETNQQQQRRSSPSNIRSSKIPCHHNDNLSSTQEINFYDKSRRWLENLIGKRMSIDAAWRKKIKIAERLRGGCGGCQSKQASSCSPRGSDCSPSPCSGRRDCCSPRFAPNTDNRACCTSSKGCGSGGGCGGNGCRGGCGNPGQTCMPRPCNTPRPMKPCNYPPISPCAPLPCSTPTSCCKIPGNCSYRTPSRANSAPSKLCECLGGGLDCKRCGCKVYQAEMWNSEKKFIIDASVSKYNYFIYDCDDTAQCGSNQKFSPLTMCFEITN